MRPRLPATQARLLRRAKTRAIAGAAIVVGASTLWIITDAGRDAIAFPRWEQGFLQRTPDGRLVEWIPPSGAERVAGGFTDWSPAVRFAGEPLPNDIVARWWCGFSYERIPVGPFAPLVERASMEVTITDTNYAPFGPGVAEQFTPAVRRVLESRRADVGYDGAGDLGAALRVIRPAPGAREGASIYWRGLPRQIALLLAAVAGSAVLLASARPALRARRLARSRIDCACPRCLYDLGGASDRCPECGQPLQEGGLKAALLLTHPASHGNRSL